MVPHLLSLLVFVGAVKKWREESLFRVVPADPLHRRDHWGNGKNGYTVLLVLLIGLERSSIPIHGQAVCTGKPGHFVTWENFLDS